MAKASKIQLPAGFKAVSAGGDSWKPEDVGASITGILHSVKSVHFDEEKKGKKVTQEARDVNVYTIRTKAGDVQVWQSAGLKALADIKKGKQVFIRFDGMGTAKKGRSAPRLYTVATK